MNLSTWVREVDNRPLYALHFSFYVSSAAPVGLPASKGTRWHPFWSTWGPSPWRRRCGRSGGRRGRCGGGRRRGEGRRGRRCRGSGRGPPARPAGPSPPPRPTRASSRTPAPGCGCTATRRRPPGRGLRLDRFWTLFFAPGMKKEFELDFGKKHFYSILAHSVTTFLFLMSTRPKRVLSEMT